MVFVLASLPAAILASTAVTAGAGIYASSKASKAQQQAAQQAQDTQMQMFDKQTALQEPFRQGGITSQNRLMDLLGLSQNTGAQGYGSAAQPFGEAQFAEDPGYTFRLKEGMKALEHSAAARGGLISGAAMKGAQRYGQEMGSQEYMNAFNRYQTERAALLNPLQSLMGSGQTAANTLSQAAQNTGNNVSELQTQAGNARACGYMGSANALTSAVNNGMNNWIGYKTFGPGSTAGAYGGAYGGG